MNKIIKKILTIFSIVVIALFTLAVFGWMVNQITTNKKEFGFLKEPIKFMYTFPDMFKKSVEEVKKLPETFIPTPDKLKTINKLEKDIIVLVTYSGDKKTRIISKINLRNDSIIQEWKIDNPFKEHNRIMNPILHPDGSIIYSFEYQEYGLRKIDTQGKLIWKQDSIVCHHGMNLDSEGNIWASTKMPGWKATGKYKLDGRDVFYLDYSITKIDHKNGKILYHKPISEIFKENNIPNYILKSTTPKDPLHLNDVQPALKSTKYYKKDDVFISIRNLSMIIHYRPSTNELIDIIEGHFSAQHDVDILDDSTIAIFNNNYYMNWSDASMPKHSDQKLITNMGDFFSNIVKYDLSNKSFSFIEKSVFIKNNIFTATEGLFEFLNGSTYFVEEQNSGILWVIKDDEVIYKNVLESQHEGHHHLPNWTRIIEYK